MKISLDSNIDLLFGVGKKIVLKLKRLGLEKVSDLFYLYPRQYEDHTLETAISNIPSRIKDKNVFLIKGAIIGISSKRTKRRAFTVTEAVIVDETGSLKVVWFNQPYLAKMFKVGSNICLYGKVRYDFFFKAYVMESPVVVKKKEILPIYPQTEGLKSNFLRKIITNVYGLIGEIEDYLPKKIVGKYSLLPLNQALYDVHFPKSFLSLQSAERRLAFDELFLISLRAKLTKERIAKRKATPIDYDLDELKKVISALPYILTLDQKKALWAIINDLKKSSPMNRLLNGDVGSGKTIVAFLAAFIAFKAGFQTLFMCPTEILANQHFLNLKGTFLKEGLSIGLLTASKKEFLGTKDLYSADVVIGTHALIQKNRQFLHVGLVIVDEQHRFGVKQREALSNIVSSGSEIEPHYLSMTATPIPRTLHLALFGDLDISVIKEKPKNRKEVKTEIVNESNRDKVYSFVKAEVKRGRQVFVICPLIEEKEDTDSDILFIDDRKSVKKEYLKLQKIFPDLKIGMLHGKLKSKEKEEIMTSFSRGDVDLLVSTSVVEVGVDVPNATIMIIEDAERYGLAQIHQFRGRIGRGDKESFCYLFTSSQSPASQQRLEALCHNSDGFSLSEIDLKLRGPGAVFGTEQSGMLDLKMASFSDSKLIAEASHAAEDIARNIDKYPKVLSRLKTLYDNPHLE